MSGLPRLPNVSRGNEETVKNLRERERGGGRESRGGGGKEKMKMQKGKKTHLVMIL